MRADGYQRRGQELAGWPVVIVSYRLDARFVCEIESAGARIAHSEGADPRGRRAAGDGRRQRPPRAHPPA